MVCVNSTQLLAMMEIFVHWTLAIHQLAVFLLLLTVMIKTTVQSIPVMQSLDANIKTLVVMTRMLAQQTPVIHYQDVINAVPVPTGDFCTGYYCDPLLGVISTTNQCPSACTGCDKQSGCIGCPGPSEFTPAQAVGLSAGVIAGIAIAGVAVVAGITYGGKRGYDAVLSSKSAVNFVDSNPFYEPVITENENPLFEPATNIDLNVQ